MIRHFKSRQRKAAGFTLVELATVMTIIAILATSILFAMFKVQQTAKEARTRSQVAKIHQLLQHRYTEYKTRSIQARAIRLVARKNQVPYMRLLALRDLMRMELPERKTDLLEFPNPNPFAASGPALLNRFPGDTQRLFGNSPPALWKAYRRRITTLTGIGPPWQSPGGDGGWGVSGVDDDGNGSTDDLLEFGTPGSDDVGWSYRHQGAECLYLILSMMRDGDSSALDFVHESEIGDTDGDGMPEILDGFDRPIEFLRWAPGFGPRPGADGQWGVAGTDDDGDGRIDNLSEAMWAGSDDIESPSLLHDITHPDDLDPLLTDPRGRRTRENNPQPAFLLVPLIFSAGRDREYGIRTDSWTSGTPYIHRNSFFGGNYFPNDPYAALNASGDQFGNTFGTGWVDNITNHNLEVD